MLLYTKVIYENDKAIRKIYGAVNNIPSEDDVEVVYKDKEGNILTLVADDTYVDDGKGGIVRLSDSKAVDVYVESTKIIPAK